MKRNVSFTLSEKVADLLDDMSEDSKPHAYKSAIVEEAIIDYSQKINYQGGNDGSEETETRSTKKTSK